MPDCLCRPFQFGLSQRICGSNTQKHCKTMARKLDCCFEENHDFNSPDDGSGREISTAQGWPVQIIFRTLFVSATGFAEEPTLLFAQEDCNLRR
jgi:hypothetical protein